MGLWPCWEYLAEAARDYLSELGLGWPHIFPRNEDHGRYTETSVVHVSHNTLGMALT